MNVLKSLESQLDHLFSENISSVIEREKITFDESSEPFGRAIILFGAGNLGRKVLEGLRRKGVEPPAFADNNPNLWDKEVEGIRVLSPEDAAKKFGRSAAFVVTIRHSKYAFIQTRQQLQKLNCSRVLSFISLFWKYSDIFLPHYYIDLPHNIYLQSENVRNAFYLWADDTSRQEYLAQLRYRIVLDNDGLPPPVGHDEYFPDDLFSLAPNEVFIDCGAFDGDTIKSFIRRRQSAFKEIAAIEPDPVNFQKLSTFVSSLNRNFKDKISLYQFAAAAYKGRTFFTATGTVESAISSNGSSEVECAPLDELLKGKVPTYIKMDIEGAELDALAGAADIIQQYLPAMAICIYHKQDHLWQVPLYIKSLSNRYRLFLRPHDFEGWDLVCYAIPEHRMQK